MCRVCNLRKGKLYWINDIKKKCAVFIDRSHQQTFIRQEADGVHLAGNSIISKGATT